MPGGSHAEVWEDLLEATKSAKLEGAESGKVVEVI